MNVEMTDLDMILNYLETTNLETHDDYTSEITYKDQKILYRYIKELQQENQQLKIQISAREEEYKKLEDNWNELKRFCIDEQVPEAPEEYDEYNSYIEFCNSVYENVLNKMQELEPGVSDVED